MTRRRGRFDVCWRKQQMLDLTVDFKSQSRKCQKVLGKNMELWENEVYRFRTIGQLKVGQGER